MILNLCKVRKCSILASECFENRDILFNSTTNLHPERAHIESELGNFSEQPGGSF